MTLSWRQVNFLFLICTVVQAGAEGHLLAFTPLLLRDMGYSAEEIGIWTGALVAAMMCVAWPLAPFWGTLAERYSRRLIAIRGYYPSAVTFLIFGFAADVGWLLVGRLVLGLCFGTMALLSATQALITPRNRLGTAIATVQVAVPISASLGPPLGSLAIPALGLRGLFFVDAGAVIVAAVALTLLMPEPAERISEKSVLARTRDVMALVWQTRPIRWNFAGTFLLRGATGVIDSYLPVRITQVAPDPAAAIGWILGLYGALTAVGNLIAGRLVDRIEEVKIFKWAMLAGAIITVGMALAPTILLLGALAVLRSLPASVAGLLLFTHIARVVPREQQTVVMTLAPMPRNAGAFLFPALAAFVTSVLPAAALGVGAGAYLAASVTGMQMSRTTPPRAVLERQALEAEV